MSRRTAGRQGRNQCGAAAPGRNQRETAANQLITDGGRPSDSQCEPPLRQAATRGGSEPPDRHVVKPRREELAPGANVCDYCTAKCCRYFALPIEAPTTHRDFDFLRWFMLHDRASVYTEDDQWYLLVHTACKHLRADHRCGIYPVRPQVCREYGTDQCEYQDDWTYERYFETPEQVEEYQEAMFSQPSEKSIRSPKPSPVP